MGLNKKVDKIRNKNMGGGGVNSRKPSLKLQHSVFSWKLSCDLAQK